METGLKSSSGWVSDRCGIGAQWFGENTLRKLWHRKMTGVWVLGFLGLLPTLSYADYFIRGEGKRQPFCEKIVATLNELRPTIDRLPCVSSVILNMPGVSDPPNWEKLDLAQHEDLAKQISTINSVGSVEYFDRRSLNVRGMWPKPKVLSQWLDEAKASQGELRLLRLPTYGEHPLATVRYQDDICGSQPPKQGELALNAVVTPDLKDLSRLGYIKYLPGRPLLYGGRIYLANTRRTGVELFFPAKDGLIDRICNIEFSSDASVGHDRHRRPAK